MQGKCPYSSLTANFRSQTCWRSPTCIVTPQNKGDVSLTLKTINFFKLQFAIRSGGHSPNPGWSSVNEPGILVDLQKLNEITLSADKKVVRLGPGGRWGAVYEALDPHQLSVIGGRIPQVGVAGLILGGTQCTLNSTGVQLTARCRGILPLLRGVWSRGRQCQEL